MGWTPKNDSLLWAYKLYGYSCTYCSTGTSTENVGSLQQIYLPVQEVLHLFTGISTRPLLTCGYGCNKNSNIFWGRSLLFSSLASLSVERRGVVVYSTDCPTRQEMRQIGGGLGGHPPPILHYSTPFLPI